MSNAVFTEEKIKSICDSVTDIDEVEALRLKYRSKSRKHLFISLAIVAIIAPVAIFTADPIISLIAIVFVIVLVGILWTTMVLPAHKKLKTMFQDKLIRNYIGAVLDNSQFIPDKHHSLDTYYESMLYTVNVDRENGENYVEGKFDKTELSFSYIHTEYKKVTHTKHGTKTSWYTIFQGVFLCADSNKHFAGKTLILPDTAEKYLGGFGKWLQRQAGNPVGEMVYMENRKFEKDFVVYSTDPVEARYLITPRIQEEIVNIKKILQTDFRLSFINGHIFVAISRGAIFQLKPSLSFTDPATLRYYLKDILELLSLIHQLDLNIRIWTKQ
ncbi:MAG: DUF3137 domain-containing protein [Prevotellaceae bacterium]|jgi:hypothetical protein|nr:DUF3137 domain-containing protein [Prevotellaceae bacterium]